jgi:hypothetical protein
MEKIRNTTRGCRLWGVKNSGCKISSPTEVKRTFIHQNLSIFIPKNNPTHHFLVVEKLLYSPRNSKNLITIFDYFYLKLLCFDA